MNFPLAHIPERTGKPRESGVTMMMDKGLSVRQAEDFCASSAPFTDFVKLGFGTAHITTELEKKMAVYRDAGISVYFGGTLFEAFYVRGQVDAYRKTLQKYKMKVVEISDGSIVLNHDEKCELIRSFSKDFTVLSEVGSKEAGILISPGKWIRMMQHELEAGSLKVIAEARESGTVGIYRPSGVAHVALVNKIVSKVKPDNILWESPKKSQQVWFIKHFGANVNLGNIGPEEVVALEALRLGLRGDTFFHFLPKKMVKRQQ